MTWKVYFWNQLFTLPNVRTLSHFFVWLCTTFAQSYTFIRRTYAQVQYICFYVFLYARLPLCIYNLVRTTCYGYTTPSPIRNLLKNYTYTIRTTITCHLICHQLEWDLFATVPMHYFSFSFAFIFTHYKIDFFALFFLYGTLEPLLTVYYSCLMAFLHLMIAT